MIASPLPGTPATAPHHSHPGATPLRSFGKYAVAFLVVGGAVLLKLLLQPYIGRESPFLIFFAAVMVVAWYGGLAAGLCATFLAALTSDYFFLEPVYTLFPDSPGQTLQLGLFMVEAGAVTFVISALRSTQRRHRQSAERLRESEARYRLHVDEVKDHAIILLDESGRITSWNAGAERIFGFAAEEIIGQPTTPLFTPEDARNGAPEKELQSARAEGRADNIRWQQRRDGTRFYANGSVTAIHDEHGNLRGYSKVLRDDTTRKNAEDALRGALRRLDFHVQNSPLAVIEWDSELRVARWSAAAERIFGFAAEEVIGHHFDEWRFVHEADVAKVRELDSQLLTNNPQQNVSRNRNYTKDGRIVRCEWYNSALLDDAGQLISVLSLVLDTTERDEARAQVVASEERYRAFVTQSSEGIWRFEGHETLTTDLPVDEQIKLIFEHGCLAECNDAMAQMYGFERAEEITGAPLSTMLDPARPENISYLEAFIRSGYRLTNAESVETTKDGEDRWFSNNLVGIVEDGALRRAWGTQRDITERKRAEAERSALLEREQAARAEAEAANRAKDQFLATLSHELRTPLTPIIGWLHLIRSGALPATEFDHGLAIINKNAVSLSNLINDLLDMSAIMSGKMRLTFERVDLAAVLREAVETSSVHAQTRNIRIELTLPDSTLPDATRERPLIVNGAHTRLVQIFWNLLNNAAKFSDDDALISVTCEADERNIRVHVEDRGAGIEPDFLPHVFSRFRQADQTMTRAHGGLGLGLALVQSFTEAHGGSVTAASAGSGQGSRFTVQLPRATAALDHAAESDGTTDAAPAMPRRTATGTNDQTAAQRILIVEDAPDTLEMLNAVFTRAGFGVTLCHSAEEALEAAAREEFACLVSDIGMPEMNGYDLLRELHRRQRAQNRQPLPALALTGYASKGDADAARDAGFAHHIAKPIDPDALLEAVEELLAAN